MNFAIIAVLSYLLGSIPFGVLLARVFKLPDPRSIGSGNIGATNMLRMGNKKVALLTLLLDAGKGVVAVLATRMVFGVNYDHVACVPAIGSGMEHCPNGFYIWPVYTAIALTFAALGHMLSPWLKFTGGKGVATILGGALAFSPAIGAFACVVWLLTYLFFRYVSLASLIMLALLPVMVGLRVDTISASIIGFACALAIYKHRSNIGRLLRGEEAKMHLKKDAA